MLRPILTRLETEALFIVEGILKAAGIKTHSVSHRVKSLEAVSGKLRKPYAGTEHVDQLNDLVGLRVVALFLSDLPKIAGLVRANFDVVDEDDKISATDAEDTFGYMSQHFVCRLPVAFAGPRYDDLKEQTFEIQLRTILMDAWANVSHYLDYKSESSIPDHLRRDFYALSGLFYVADKHFEMFFSESLESQAAAAEALSSRPLEDLPLNLDTVEALLAQRYPDREHTPRSAISGLVEELAHFGYSTIAEVEALLDAHTDWLLDDEKWDPPSALIDGKFQRVRYSGEGVLRCCLRKEVGEEAYRRQFPPQPLEDDAPTALSSPSDPL